ncbi:acyl-CoA thioesterase [Gimibacter soli]|uniref:Acyl-CoA thioesterase n=1 Tax=Gimibacter soli TaxID=3024400 RepID=A0AAF0BHK1_9PROT|nr:acyl-CoA thioesterase [Gimibacter soli]WCL54343.1 acyl-CoA thioesterase [Gimibacter soli]
MEGSSMTPDHPLFAGPTRLADIVFPGDANHHGTLFGGTGLAHMDKVAFIAASRHAHVDFVTASCERIDFEAPAMIGDIVELTGSVVRVGRKSLSVEVDMVAEGPITGERRHCSRGIFNMVAVGPRLAAIGGVLPPLTPAPTAPVDPALHSAMVEIVFPERTSHYGSLYGGHALAAMGKAAFIAASRHSRKTVVMAGTERVDFTNQIQNGEVVITLPRILATGRSSVRVEVQLWAENLHTDVRRQCGRGEFVMVAVDATHRPVPLAQ